MLRPHLAMLEVSYSRWVTSPQVVYGRFVCPSVSLYVLCVPRFSACFQRSRASTWQAGEDPTCLSWEVPALAGHRVELG